jgi:hypothetical protein
VVVVVVTGKEKNNFLCERKEEEKFSGFLRDRLEAEVKPPTISHDNDEEKKIFSSEDGLSVCILSLVRSYT